MLRPGIPCCHVYSTAFCFLAVSPFLLIFINLFSDTCTHLCSLPTTPSILDSERMFATIRTQLLENSPSYLNTSRPICLKSSTPFHLIANHNENCRFTNQKEREEKSKERCLVSKQQLTLDAASAAGWVPEFPCFCLRLHILFLRNLTCLTSLNMSGFTSPLIHNYSTLQSKTFMRENLTPRLITSSCYL